MAEPFKCLSFEVHVFTGRDGKRMWSFTLPSGERTLPTVASKSAVEMLQWEAIAASKEGWRDGV